METDSVAFFVILKLHSSKTKARQASTIKSNQYASIATNIERYISYVESGENTMIDALHLK